MATPKTSDDLRDGEKTPAEYNNDSEASTTAELPSDDPLPIVYHYLDFSTPLPVPSAPCFTLPPPDLKPFTNPFEWSETRKNLTLWMSCIATLITAYTAGSYSVAAAQMSAEWHVSEVAIEVGITTFCFGFAIAPMVLAPFSEINGRYPVFVGAGILYFICKSCFLCIGIWC